MQRKGNPYTVVVDMQTGATTAESSMEVPFETKRPHDPATPQARMEATQVPIYRRLV